MNNELIKIIENLRDKKNEELLNRESPVKLFMDDAFMRLNKIDISKFSKEEIDIVEDYIYFNWIIDPNFKLFFTNDAFYQFLKTGKNAGKTYHVWFYVIYRLLKNPNGHFLVTRKEKQMLKDSTMKSFKQCLGIIRDKTGVDMMPLFQFKESPQDMKYIFKPTGQEIIFKGFKKEDMSQGVDVPFGDWELVWFDELLEFSKKNQLSPKEMMIMIDTLESSMFARKKSIYKTRPRMIFTLNPTVPKHIIFDKFVKPFRGVQHTEEERLKNQKQEVLDMDAFNGEGIYLLDASVFINSNLTDEYKKKIEKRRQLDYELYLNIDLGLDVAYIQDCYGSNSTKLIKIDESNNKYDGFIAGGDWGKGHDTCFNFIGYFYNEFGEIIIDYLDEIYIVGNILDDNTKKKQIINFYIDCIKTYKPKTEQIICAVDNREALLDTELNNQAQRQQLYKMWFEPCHKGRIQDRILQTRSLLANEQFRCLNKTNNNGDNIYDELIGEMQNAYLDDMGNRKGDDHRLDGLDYALEEIL